MCTLVPREVLVRILVKSLLAPGRAEVIGVATTKRAEFGRSRVHHHAADRICRRPSAFHIVSLATKGLLLTDERRSPNRVPGRIAFECRATRSRTEVVRLAAKVGLVGGGGRIDAHSAHRVPDKLCTGLWSASVRPQHFDSAG